MYIWCVCVWPVLLLYLHTPVHCTNDARHIRGNGLDGCLQISRLKEMPSFIGVLAKRILQLFRHLIEAPKALEEKETKNWPCNGRSREDDDIPWRGTFIRLPAYLIWKWLALTMLSIFSLDIPKSVASMLNHSTCLLTCQLSGTGMSKENAISKSPKSCAKGRGNGTSAILRQLLKPNLGRMAELSKKLGTLRTHGKSGNRSKEMSGGQASVLIKEHAIGKFLVHSWLNWRGDVDILHGIRQIPNDPIHHTGDGIIWLPKELNLLLGRKLKNHILMIIIIWLSTVKGLPLNHFWSLPPHLFLVDPHASSCQYTFCMDFLHSLVVSLCQAICRHSAQKSIVHLEALLFSQNAIRFALVAFVQCAFPRDFCKGVELRKGICPLAVHEVQLGHRL